MAKRRRQRSSYGRRRRRRRYGDDTGAPIVLAPKRKFQFTMPMKIAAIGAAMVVVYFGVIWIGAAVAEGGSPGLTLPALVATYSPMFGVDPRAVMTILHMEGGQWVAGDDNSSFGPLQVHKGGLSTIYPGAGAVDAWEAQNGSVADANGAYDYLANDPLSVKIGIWNIAQVFSANGGPSVASFAAYNGSGSAAQAYGKKAYSYYQGLA